LDRLTPLGIKAVADLNLAVVNTRQHLVEVAHVDIGPAERAIAEMIGLGIGNAVRIEAATIPDCVIDPAPASGVPMLVLPRRETRIFVFAPISDLRYGQFQIDLAAGLEESLIIAVAPPWNGREGKRLLTEEAKARSHGRD
jgi:hypothetical protein